MKHVSLREIAERVGMSTQTVSRALRGEPRVRAEVRSKIKRVAARLGYTPDPRLKALLGHLRKRKVAARETITLVLPDSEVRELAKLYYLGEMARGARARAETHGFQLELHSLQGQTAVKTLERQMLARGQDLLIVAPYVHTLHGTLPLHWERYAAVTVGPALWRPRLSRTSVNYYLNMLQLLRQLKRLGYRRPALVCRKHVLERQMYVWEAAFRQFAPLLGLEGDVWREGVEEADFLQWLRERRADVVIDDYHGTLEVLRRDGVRVPGEVGFASLTWNPREPEISGFDPRMDLLGAHAVDLVVEQFYHHERGVPADPKLVLHEGVWREGNTTRKISNGRLRNPAPGSPAPDSR